MECLDSNLIRGRKVEIFEKVIPAPNVAKVYLKSLCKVYVNEPVSPRSGVFVEGRGSRGQGLVEIQLLTRPRWEGV